MNAVMIDLPESLLLTTGQSRDEFVKEAKFLLMAKLFEMGRVSSGKAAEICGMQRIDFIYAAGQMGIPVVQLDEDELAREFENVKTHCGALVTRC
jgi:predicted HTH domain antitoxin